MADDERRLPGSIDNVGNEEIPEPIFQNGQLTHLGRDIEFIPQQLVEDYCNITSRLDLSYNRLQSLKGLQHFKFLKELVLDNNDLDDSVVFPPLKQLQTLTMNKNKLTDLNKLLEQLCSAYPNLTYLSLLGNEACPNQLSSCDKDEEDYQRYRYYVVFKIQNLKFLDSTQVTTTELTEAKRVGPFMKVVKPEDTDEKESSHLSSSPGSKYTPLPSHPEEQNSSDHQGTFGKSRYVYYGRHSEGNRFIRNRDL